MSIPHNISKVILIAVLFATLTVHCMQTGKNGETPLDRLLGWMQNDGGIDVSKIVSLVETRYSKSSGRSLFAKSFIPSGTVLLQFPVANISQNGDLSILHDSKGKPLNSLILRYDVIHQSLMIWLEKAPKELLSRLYETPSLPLLCIFLMFDRIWVPTMLRYRNHLQKKKDFSFSMTCSNNLPPISSIDLSPMYNIRSNQESSFWQPFYDNLPSRNDFKTFIPYWNGSDWRKLRNSSLFIHYATHIISLRRTWALLKPIMEDIRNYLEKQMMQLHNQHPKISRNFRLMKLSRDDFVENYMVELSRCFYPGVMGLTGRYARANVFAPYFDLINTDPTNNERGNIEPLAQRQNSSIVSSLVAKRDIQPGEELIYIYHASFKTTDWLEIYGMCRNLTQRNNPDDFICIRDALVRNAEKYIGFSLKSPEKELDVFAQKIKNHYVLKTKELFRMHPLILSDVMIHNSRGINKGLLGFINMVVNYKDRKTNEDISNTSEWGGNIDKRICKFLFEVFSDKYSDLTKDHSLKADIKELKSIERKLVQEPTAQLYKRYCIVSYVTQEKRITKQWIKLMEVCLLS